MEITRILKGLERNTGTFPREALEAAVERREEITPELLRILEDTAARAQEIVEEDTDGAYFAHLYAMYLLAQFREARAYPLVVQLCRLDEEVLDALTGDFLTEDLCRVLASVCGGDTRPIEGLIGDPEVHEYMRGAALRSLLVLVAAGDKSRDEVMAYFKALFEGRLERSHSHAWDSLVACAARLYPAEVHDYILEAYEEGLVNPGFISPGEVQRALNQDKTTVLERLISDERGYIGDVTEEMRWWACFEQPKRPARRTTPLPPRPIEQVPRAPYEPLRSTKVKPNEPCTCGSGKKYKKCCGRVGANPGRAASGCGASKTTRQILRRQDVNVRAEAERIMERALEGVTSIVTLGPVVFFSTETGDAWMLDPEDGAALCLARGYQPQPYTITETPGTFSIRWDAQYSIAGEEFVVTESSGRMRRILGYPTRKIEKAIRAVH